MPRFGNRHKNSTQFASSKVSFYTFLSSLQEIDVKLIQYDDLCNQRLGEISCIEYVFNKVVDYQLHEASPTGIKTFSFIKIKSFEVFIDSWKTDVKDTIDLIVQSRKTCENIWNSSKDVLEAVSLP